MTRNEANDKLNQACDLIFQVEEQFKLGEYPRLFAYQARCKVGDFQNAIREKFPLTKQNSVVG